MLFLLFCFVFICGLTSLLLKESRRKELIKWSSIVMNSCVFSYGSLIPSSPEFHVIPKVLFMFIICYFLLCRNDSLQEILLEIS